jgi:DMSO/TMAO reductase YedYZ molybdopterin-dependent catalytic subunit
MASDDEPSGISRARFLTGAVGAGGLLVGAALGYAGAEALDDEEDDDGQEAATTEQETAPTETEAEEAAGELPDGKSEEDFVVHGTDPLNIETKREVLGAATLTSAPALFIRQNHPLPDESILDDREGWTISVEGVAQPRELTIAELRRIGVTEVAAVLQCSGNGRGYFEHDPSGSPWQVGAAGNVVWTGVPVAALVEELGGADSAARFMTGTGGEEIPSDVPEREAVVERSVPIEKGLEDAILAWEMNGAPVPLSHGGPLRMIVPGYFAINSVKFLKRLAFTEQESDADIMVSSYRMRPVGEDSDPSQPTCWEHNVKSFVTSPAHEAQVAGGPVRVVGVAYSYDGVEGVEVSTDGGETWEAAEFYGTDLGRYAWRRFTHVFDAEPGSYTIASRATDGAGNTQPEQREDNEAGYQHNGWRDPAVTVEVT